MEERGVSVGPDGSRLQSRYRRIYVNSILLFLSLIASLAVAELLSRTFYDDGQAGHQKLFIEHDPLLGWRMVPNKTGRQVTDEYEITESINSKGIRGPEYSYIKGSNEFRILILGDSFAEGYTVEFEELVSEILKKRLNERNDRFYQVINAGTAGYSTDQELLFFQKEGRKYNPDLTVLLFFENDVRYNTRQKYWRGNKPLFELRDNQLILTNVPVPEPEAVSDDTYRGGQSDPGSLSAVVKGWLRTNSSLYRWILETVKKNNYLYNLAGKLHLLERGQEPGSVRIPETFRVWERSYNDATVDAWRITEELIRKLRDEVTAIESDFLVWYVPRRTSIYLEEWEDTKRRYGLSDEAWNVNQTAKELREVCAKYGIAFINPTPAFKAEAIAVGSKGRGLYYVNDAHWTPEGHALAGRLLAEYVNDHNAGE